MRIVYGNVVLGGDDREQGALGECTVADVAALRAAHEAGLAGGERREVVVVQVALALGHVDRVDALPLGKHAQRQHREDLRLTAGEQARAVAARQVAGDRGDLADLVELAAVGALALVEDHRAHGLLLELLERRP